jgi:hypothetical protein
MFQLSFILLVVVALIVTLSVDAGTSISVSVIYFLLSSKFWNRNQEFAMLLHIVKFILASFCDRWQTRTRMN